MNLERNLVWSSEEGVTWVALAAASSRRGALLELIYLSAVIFHLASAHWSPRSHPVYRSCSVRVLPKALSKCDEQTRKARGIPWVKRRRANKIFRKKINSLGKSMSGDNKKRKPSPTCN